jgi:hypothetical protein
MEINVLFLMVNKTYDKGTYNFIINTIIPTNNTIILIIFIFLNTIIIIISSINLNTITITIFMII